MSDFRQMLKKKKKKKKKEDLEFAPIDRRALRVAPVKTASTVLLNWVLFWEVLHKQVPKPLNYCSTK